MNKYLILVFVFCLSCNTKEDKKDNSFILLERNSYYTSSSNEILIYRLNDGGKVMNGYYVVGDKFTKWEEFNVKNGVLNGLYITFHPNGNFSSQSNYVNGRLHGEEKYFYTSGKLQSVLNYKNGKKAGETFSYFESGQLRSKSKLENEKVVESTTYDIIGGIQSQMFLRNGHSVTQTIRNGAVYKEDISSNHDDFEAVKLFNNDGSLKHYLRMTDEDESPIIIELDSLGNELKRISFKEKPQEVIKYMELISN